jgi:hypothetical protein
VVRSLEDVIAIGSGSKSPLDSSLLAIEFGAGGHDHEERPSQFGGLSRLQPRTAARLVSCERRWGLMREGSRIRRIDKRVKPGAKVPLTEEMLGALIHEVFGQCS